MIKNNDATILCLIHKGFRGFRAVLSASILGGNLLGLKPAIPYVTYNLPKWVPREINNKKVAVMLTIPIHVNLEL